MNSKTTPLLKKADGSGLYGKFGIFFILLATMVAGVFFSSSFLSAANIINVIRQNATSAWSHPAAGRLIVLILRRGWTVPRLRAASPDAWAPW